MKPRFLSRFPVPALGAAAVLLLLLGCSGGSAGHPASQPPDAPPPSGAQPPQSTLPDIPKGFNVTITTTSSGLVYVDNLEVEANRRRGIYAFMGFYPNQFDQMAQVPFQDITQVSFLGPMPQNMFDVVKETRENQNLHLDEFFDTYVTLKNGDKQEFYAYIPKIRGYKDFQVWEFSMNSLNNGIQKIEFDR